MIEALGWLGNACFFSRFFVQWILSERARRSVTPEIFWRISLLGSALLAVYSADRRAYVLLAAYVLNGLIYSRNIVLQRSQRPAAMTRSAATTLALAAVIGIGGAGAVDIVSRPGSSAAWTLLGVLGQLLWSSRFVVQWFESERKGVSHFPAVFWWQSLAGNTLNLAYTWHLGDPVFFIGYLPGPLVQVRNIMLGRRAAPGALTEQADPVDSTTASGSAAR